MVYLSKDTGLRYRWLWKLTDSMQTIVGLAALRQNANEWHKLRMLLELRMPSLVNTRETDQRYT